MRPLISSVLQPSLAPMLRATFHELAGCPAGVWATAASCMRVLTTSNGFVTSDASAPAQIPAPKCCTCPCANVIGSGSQERAYVYNQPPLALIKSASVHKTCEQERKCAQDLRTRAQVCTRLANKSASVHKTCEQERKCAQDFQVFVWSNMA
jgi:hypothetical protein